MIYVFDSNALIDLFSNYYPMRFPSLWKKFEEYIPTTIVGEIATAYSMLGTIK